MRGLKQFVDIVRPIHQKAIACSEHMKNGRYHYCVMSDRSKKAVQIGPFAESPFLAWKAAAEKFK